MLQSLVHSWVLVLLHLLLNKPLNDCVLPSFLLGLRLQKDNVISSLVVATGFKEGVQISLDPIVKLHGETSAIFHCKVVLFNYGAAFFRLELLKKIVKVCGGLFIFDLRHWVHFFAKKD